MINPVTSIFADNNFISTRLDSQLITYSRKENASSISCNFQNVKLIHYVYMNTADCTYARAREARVDDDDDDDDASAARVQSRGGSGRYNEIARAAT